MKSKEVYLEDLRKQLTKMDLPYQDELLVEIRHQIEDGLLDSKNGHSPEERMTKIMKEMGSSKEMAQGLYNTHTRHTWVDVLLAVGPLLAAMIAGRIFLDAPFSPTKYFEVGTVYSVFYFLVCAGMVWLSIRRKRQMLELWWLAWSLVIFADIFYGQFMLTKSSWLGSMHRVLFPSNWAMLLIFGAGLLASGILASRRLWRGRLNGTLILIFILPGIFTLLTKGMNILEGSLNPQYAYKYYNDLLLYAPGTGLDWWKVMKVANYLLLAAGIMLVPNRRTRWLLVAGISTVYIIGTMIMMQMSLPTLAVFAASSAALLAACMWIDFRKSKTPELQEG